MAIAKAFELTALLRGQGCPVDILRTRRVGAVLYEETLQVVAEPSADTPV